MRDFTLKKIKMLLAELFHTGYSFVTFAEFMKTKPGEDKLIILRHDVDRLPGQALKMAKIEHEMGVKASYYFRCQKNDFDKNIIKEVAALNHEIGYHYETMKSCDGNIENAFTEFKKNLESLREMVPVTTICRHGSPKSKWDNVEIWKFHDYKELGILGEPYLDIDFNEILYLTDTGRRWDGEKVSIRDRVSGYRQVARGKWEGEKQKEKDSRGAVCDPPALHHESVVSREKLVVSSKKKETANKLKLHLTMDIIKALDNDLLPDKIMLTIHPQRWNDNYFYWLYELIWQKIKNPVKFVKIRRMEKFRKIKNGK